MQPGSDFSTSYYNNYNPPHPPHLQNPNPNPNPNPTSTDLLSQTYASAPPFSNYSSSDYPTNYSSPYPPYSQNPDPVPNLPLTAPSYRQPQSPYPSFPSSTATSDSPVPPSYPHLQQQPPSVPYFPYDHHPTATNYAPPHPPNPNPNPNPNSNPSFSSSYPPSYAPSGYGYQDENSSRYGFARAASNSQTDFYEKGGRGYEQARPRRDGLDEGIYAYDGGKVEPYGARGIGGLKTSSSMFDDYGRSISFGKEQVGSGKIVRAVPKAETQEDVKNGVQKFRVKLLPEGAGQDTMDVLCQVHSGNL